MAGEYTLWHRTSLQCLGGTMSKLFYALFTADMPAWQVWHLLQMCIAAVSTSWALQISRLYSTASQRTGAHSAMACS